MDDKRAFLAASWRSFWAEPPPPPSVLPVAPDSIFGQITGGIAALLPSSWLESLICRLFQADPNKVRLRYNGMCCLSLQELMVVAIMSSSLHVTAADQHSASTPAELFALLSGMAAFDVNLFLTLQYLVGMGWRCCDGSKYGANLVAYSRHRTHSMYCVTVSCSPGLNLAASCSPAPASPIVQVLQPRAQLLDVIAAQRVAEACMKACMLAHVAMPSSSSSSSSSSDLTHVLSSFEVLLLPVNRARVDIAGDDADLDAL
jgi:hypothetical protein